MEFLLTKRQVNLVDFDSMWGNTQTKQGIPKRCVCLFAPPASALVAAAVAVVVVAAVAIAVVATASDKKELNKSTENIIKIPEWATISNYN